MKLPAKTESVCCFSPNVNIYCASDLVMMPGFSFCLWVCAIQNNYKHFCPRRWSDDASYDLVSSSFLSIAPPLTVILIKIVVHFQLVSPVLLAFEFDFQDTVIYVPELFFA